MVKHIFRLTFLAGAFLSILACDDDNCDVVPDTFCYSFDIRQCDTDVFAEVVPLDASQEDREAALADWLEGQGIDVVAVNLVLNFHQAVCEACDVCPQGDRYFIELGKALSQPEQQEFRLLDLEERGCDD